MRIGWLGLGAMGAPMASCLARAGHDVAGDDVVPGRAASLAAAGSGPRTPSPPRRGTPI